MCPPSTVQGDSSIPTPFLFDSLGPGTQGHVVEVIRSAAYTPV